MVAFLFYVQRFFDPIRSLTIQYSIMQRAMAAGQRIFEVLDVPIDVRDAPGAAPLPREARVLELDGRDLRLRARPTGAAQRQPAGGAGRDGGAGGVRPAPARPASPRSSTASTTCGAGRYGSGESTCAMCARATSARTWRWCCRSLSCSPAASTTTSATTGRTRPARKVEAAARAVGAHDFIERLAQGYDSVLDQRGSNLSLGQRQLLSFARALVADAPILVLDEATANVDSYTERQIQKALARLLEGRTAIVIAHRLATIRGADRILVLRERPARGAGHPRRVARARRALRPPLPAQPCVLR